MNYLEEAAAVLRRANTANEEAARAAKYDHERLRVHEERLRIAAAFTRLAAIDRDLLPPDMITPRTDPS